WKVAAAPTVAGRHSRRLGARRLRRGPLGDPRRPPFLGSRPVMNSGLPARGVNVPAVVWNSGLGGPCGWPVLVMNAKLNASRPVRFRQSALLRVSVLSARCRLKIAIAAHHLVALQLEPPLIICDAGQGTQPGG